jgi:hypothetical protein
MYKNGKIRPAETVPGMGMGRIKENDREWWIQLGYIVRNFVNVTLYPQYNKNAQKIKKWLVINKSINKLSGLVLYQQRSAHLDRNPLVII